MGKKISLLITLFIVSGMIGLPWLYKAATDPVTDGKEKAVQRAKEETDLQEVNSVDWFHYKHSYYVIDGKDRKGTEVFVCVPYDPQDKIIIVNKNDGLSEEEAIRVLNSGSLNIANDKRPKKIIDIKPGVVNDSPAYKITYIDMEDRYSFLYIDFYKGEWYRIYNL